MAWCPTDDWPFSELITANFTDAHMRHKASKCSTMQSWRISLLIESLGGLRPDKVRYSKSGQCIHARLVIINIVSADAQATNHHYNADDCSRFCTIQYVNEDLFCFILISYSMQRAGASFKQRLAKLAELIIWKYISTKLTGYNYSSMPWVRRPFSQNSIIVNAWMSNKSITKHIWDPIIHPCIEPGPWSMMTSSNGNIFDVTGPLCGNLLVPGEFPS